MRAQTVADKKAAKRATVIAALNNLPGSIGRHRVLDAAMAAQFWGVSLPHWRRLYRARKVPAPFKVGERKLGWTAGMLIDAQAERAAEVA